MALSPNKIGFMQGRLSPLIDNQIQCFPWPFWREEFSIAQSIQLSIIEWTLDAFNLYSNPLLTHEGYKDIVNLCSTYTISIPSLTGDCFMQSPFWKADGQEKSSLIEDFWLIISACYKLQIKYVILPLVDQGRIENSQQESYLIDFFASALPKLKEFNVNILFESDYAPSSLANFISRFDHNTFGINYDIGNSASLGFNPIDEFDQYAARIKNVHIKDRVFNGSTVPLLTGDADIPLVLQLLDSSNYNGNLILQTARSQDNMHKECLVSYKNIVESIILSL